jgi:hypothetical protein
VGTIGATLLMNLCEQTCEHAFDPVLQHAAALGANAVVGMCYDVTKIIQGVTEVLAYGTAVYVEKKSRRILRDRTQDSVEVFAEAPEGFELLGRGFDGLGLGQEDLASIALDEDTHNFTHSPAGSSDDF